MKKIIIFAAALAALVSCNKSVIVSSVEADELGFISLGISTSDVMVETKGLTANEALTGYNITIIDKINSTTYWEGEYEEAKDESVWKVAPGTYTIKVENKTKDEAYPDNSAGAIRIAGQKDVDVSAYQTSICTVECYPVNAKVSFYATSEFLTVFSDPTVSVTGGTRTVSLGAVTTSEGTPTPAFFEPGEITWNLTATVDGKSKNYSGKLTLVTKQWSKVTFNTSSTNGGISITITVDGNMTEVNVPTAVDPLQ